MAPLIQWNCNGALHHYPDLRLLISELAPACLALQETRFKPADVFSPRGYSVFRTDYTEAQIACGGVAILVRDTLYHEPVTLNTDLQAVAIRVTFPMQVTVCSLYLPPGVRVDVRDVIDLLEQLPAPFMLMGDFNAHNMLWGSVRNDTRGRQLANLFSNLNLTVLNNGENTHFCRANSSFSAIDLSVSSAAISPLFEWNVHADLHGSNHFPVVVTPLFGTASETRWPKWVLRKADWTEFATSVVVNDIPDASIEEEIDNLTDSILTAARESIPQSSTRPGRVPVPWWNEDCSLARREKNRLFSIFRRFPTEENMVAYLRAKARSQRIVKLSKRRSWRNYVSTITVSTPPAKVWEKVRKLSGNSISPGISGLLANGNIVTDPVDIANTLGTRFASISSSENFPPEFLTRKRFVESIPLNFFSMNSEDYNLLFSRFEMDSALKMCKDSSPGPDAIHYQMLKHLPETCMSKLLDVYNKIWVEGIYPAQWKESFVVPIPKAGKDRKSPSSYRPISLTSCVSKLLERMISKRLVWFLESNGLLTNTQCGFRRHRSTVDHLVRLETAIRNAFLNKQHLVAVFLISRELMTPRGDSGSYAHFILGVLEAA